MAIVKPKPSSIFQPAPTKISRTSVLMDIYGDTSTGRTTLALTAPDPIAYIHTCEKWYGILQQFSIDKEIHLVDVGMTGSLQGGKDQTQKQANECIERFKRAWEDAFGWARTIVLDTDTELYITLQLARFGTQNPKAASGSFAWAPLTAEWLSYIKFAKHHVEEGRVNVIFVGSTKDEYKGPPGKGTRTGKTLRAGQRDILTAADVRVRTSRGPNGEFVGTLKKGWYNAALEEVLQLEDSESTFANYMEMITGIDASEWS